MADFFGFAQELLNKGRAREGDPYADAELYDLLVREGKDDHFYVRFAREQGGRVLDLACGSGRLLPRLLKAGLEVTGLDLSPQMLKQAKARVGAATSRLELVEGDMRDFSLSQSYDTIIIPYCSLIYMHSDADRLRVFQNCHSHLKSGGYLVFDFLAGEVDLGAGWPQLAMQGIHPFTEDILISVVQIKGLSCDLRLLNQIDYSYPKEPGVPTITVYSSMEAVVSPQRMTELLLRAGLDVGSIQQLLVTGIRWGRGMLDHCPKTEGAERNFMTETGKKDVRWG